jgi:hypothetical protein
VRARQSVGIALVVLCAAALWAPVATNVQAKPPGGGGGGIPFAGCGTWVEGVECVLFQADAGGLYIVGGNPVGVRSFVQGTIDPFCLSYCQQGDGCIFNATISECIESGGATAPPVYDFQDLIDVISAWGECDHDAKCEWDLNGDGSVDVNDLIIVIDGMN